MGHVTTCAELGPANVIAQVAVSARLDCEIVKGADEATTLVATAGPRFVATNERVWDRVCVTTVPVADPTSLKSDWAQAIAGAIVKTTPATSLAAKLLKSIPEQPSRLRRATLEVGHGRSILPDDAGAIAISRPVSG